MPWFRRRRAVAEHEQQRLWRQARMKTDIQHFVSKMSELEIVESFNAIERHLLGEMQVSLPYNCLDYTKILADYPKIVFHHV